MPRITKLDDCRAWRRVTLGRYKTGEEYLQAILDAGTETDDFSKAMLRSPEFKCSAGVIDLELAKMMVGDIFGFGLDAPHKASAIQTRILDIGFQLCPAEVGPATCPSDAELGFGRWAIVLMEPIIIPSPHIHFPGGVPAVFEFDHINQQAMALFGRAWNPEETDFGSGTEIIVIKPR